MRRVPPCQMQIGSQYSIRWQQRNKTIIAVAFLVAASDNIYLFSNMRMFRGCDFVAFETDSELPTVGEMEISK